MTRYVPNAALPVIAPPEPLQCGRFTLTFERPLVMGILNITPDSFSDGGKFAARGDALRQAERMMLDGADIIDIGGESTRPGALPVPLDEELERVIPLIEQLRSAQVPLSVDTYKPEVMRHALAAGADLVNDIWGFRMPGAIDAVRDSQCGLCVMHMLGEPQTMQVDEPPYRDVVSEVRTFLEERVAALTGAGGRETAHQRRPRFWLRQGHDRTQLRFAGPFARHGAARRATVSDIGGHVAQVDARCGHWPCRA